MFDFLIIGQGLAGSLLAWQLQRKQKTYLIIDNAEENASKVAAGLINPMTGMRLAKKDNVEDLLCHATSLYKDLEKKFNKNFYAEKTMLRILQNEPELLAAHKRLSQTSYHEYIGNLLDEYTGLNTSYPILEQKKTGLLNIPELLLSLKTFFIDRQQYKKSNVDYANILFDEINVYEDIKFKNIIFCEGSKLQYNPFFDWLPIKPVKGQTLTFKNNKPNVINDFIVNYGYWLISLGENMYRTGATFEREFEHDRITISAKNDLINSLNKYVENTQSIDVVEQQAGLRATTPDRAPIIGSHPVMKNMYVFNGFGAKGALLIPYYSQLFVEHLLDDKPLPDDVNANRFINDDFSHSRSA